MPITEITDFKGDPWKKQEGESDRAHHYFKQYKKQNLSRHKFKQLLLTEADERSSKGHIKFWGADLTFNKKHQDKIQSYVDSQGKKGQCPKPCGTLDDWFRFHKWFTRKQDYTKFQEEEADSVIRAMITENKPKMAKDILDNIELTNQQRKKQKEQGVSSLSQDKAGAESINTDIDSLNKLSNNDVQKMDISADVDTKAEVEHKASITQDIILKPEYVELTRKLLEDVIDDS